MFSVFVPSESSLKKHPVTDPALLPDPVTLLPPQRHKCAPAVNARVMKRLPESRLVLLG